MPPPCKPRASLISVTYDRARRWQTETVVFKSVLQYHQWITVAEKLNFHIIIIIIIIIITIIIIIIIIIIIMLALSSCVPRIFQAHGMLIQSNPDFEYPSRAISG
jgi:hypothetical protein